MFRSSLVTAGAFVCGALLATLCTSPIAAQDRKTESRELLRLDLGAWCPGKEVLITHLTNSAGSIARHSHPAHSFTYVMEGAQTITPDGQAPYTVKAGEVQHESPYEISATRTIEPAKVLNIRILEKGKPVTIPAP